MTQRERRSRPTPAKVEAAEISSANQIDSSVPRSGDHLADVDALASQLQGRFVVQVVVDVDRDYRRTNVYRSCAAAERAVRRANDRGQRAHVSLVQMLPVGVVVGLGGPR